MKLKTLEVKAFGGINPNSPVIIDFSKSKWVVAEGDNGLNKTSLLNAMLVACGQIARDKDFVNNETQKIDIDFEFVGNDRYTYQVRCTKSQFSLTYEGEAIPEPITKMKELLGIVGVSPMAIKEKPLKDIVKWLSSYSTKGAEEYEKQFIKLKDAIGKCRTSRADANKVLKGLVEYLDNEPMFKDWEGSEKKYSESPDIKQLSSDLQKAGNKSDKYIENEIKVKGQVERKTQLEQQIAQLQKELGTVEENITIGNVWLEQNKDAKKEYDQVKKKYDTAAQDVVNHNKWQEIKAKSEEKNQWETASQRADTKEKELLQEVKVLQAEILPDIKGVELITEDTYDNGSLKKEGLYMNGKNVAQLSESEWWTLVLSIWRKYKVRIIVIDNYQDLGSMAVDILEKLNNDGCYILAAEMNREQKSLQIEYKS
jgi:hypothetical protein